ncbi:uncharacterized protein UHOR_13182 [Ustilago hordei]|uniref:Integrase catalytic domain-containing protein n=1 Tax=Ustilago hordei TaxID=120017 RepID=I2FNF2_USTHO|nr:uncharacterized protein UHOR_13182 [Ustilago hordei]
MLLKITKNRERGLLELRGDTWLESAMITSIPLLEGVDEELEQTESKTNVSKQQLWHECLGHPGQDKTRAIINKLKDKHTVDMDPDTALTCEQCIRSKSTVAQMGQGSRDRTASLLDLIHIDLIIDSSHTTEHTCMLVLVDDHSKYVCVQPLLRKSHAFTQLKKMVSFLKTQTGKELKAICSDQGTKWRSNEAMEWTHSKGIEWQMMNRWVKRMNRSLGEKMRTLLMQRRLPKRFWPYAIWAAAFKMNLTPSVDNKFPYQVMFGKSLEQMISLIWVFGCLVWVNIPRVKWDNKKLDQRAVASIFLGYSLEKRGWLFYSPDYNPNIFWKWQPINVHLPPAVSDEVDLNDLGYTTENLFDKRDKEPLNEHMDMHQINEMSEEETSSDDPREPTELEPNAETWIDGNHTAFMVASIRKGKNMDPTVQEALAGEDRRHWEEAMQKELEGLEAMGTWEVANLPPGTSTVDTKWVLKNKTDANLIPIKFKARLVAWGFTQRKGIDYMEVFAPVAPIQSIWGVLAITAIKDWEVHSIDVKQAYLNLNLHHDMYLKLPVGTKIPIGKALKLMKGLYGLKQSG